MAHKEEHLAIAEEGFMKKLAAYASAAIVNVGFDVPIVGILPQPTRNKLGWCHVR